MLEASFVAWNPVARLHIAEFHSTRQPAAARRRPNPDDATAVFGRKSRLFHVGVETNSPPKDFVENFDALTGFDRPSHSDGEFRRLPRGGCPIGARRATAKPGAVA
jgi:hypothetical protein